MECNEMEWNGMEWDEMEWWRSCLEGLGQLARGVLAQQRRHRRVDLEHLRSSRSRSRSGSGSGSGGRGRGRRDEGGHPATQQR